MEINLHGAANIAPRCAIILTLRRGWARFFPLRCGSSAGGNLGYAAIAIDKLTPVAPPEDVMRPWRTPSPRIRYRLHHRCRWTEIARQLMDPGQGVSCWAKHCADPAPDRHTVGAAEISPAQDSGRRCSLLVLSGNFSEVPKYHTLSGKIPHGKSQLLRECAKNAQLGARAW